MSAAQSSLVTWNSTRPWLGTVIRLVLGAIWLWAAVSEVASPRTFVQAVRAYDATPEWLSKGIGYGLPVLELCLGVLLFLGLLVRISAVISGLLFLVFLIGIGQAAARGIQLACGCFGGGGTTVGGTSYTLDILRDVGLLVLAAYLVVWSFTRLSMDEFLSRNDHVAPPSAKRMRTEQGRNKYDAMLEQRRRTARSREAWLTGSLAALVVLIVMIGLGVQAGRSKIAGSLSARSASVSDGVVFGKKAAATVDIYEDFQCPLCLQFEQAAGTRLDSAVRANKAQIRFHIIAFLDRSSNGNRYSSRAANAALCASDISVDDFVAFHQILYGTIGGEQVQPGENGNGRTDAELGTYAKKAGIDGTQLTTFEDCVRSEQHKALVAAITDRASQDGVNGTPTVQVNGTTVKNSLVAVTKAISAADASGPAPVPSKTPVTSAKTSATTPGRPTSPSGKPSAAVSPSPSPSATKSG